MTDENVLIHHVDMNIVKIYQVNKVINDYSITNVSMRSFYWIIS